MNAQEYHLVMRLGPEWLRKLRYVVHQTGYTASLVQRTGELLVTIDPQCGDRVIARRNGRHGLFTA